MQAESSAPAAPVSKDAGKRAGKARPLLFLAMVPAEWTLWSVIEVGGVLSLIVFLHFWVSLGASVLPQLGLLLSPRACLPHAARFPFVRVGCVRRSCWGTVASGRTG